MSATQIISGAFTPFFVMPVSDGSTKSFVLQCSGDVTQITLRIFTKWGTTIFESDNYDNSWDGTNAAAGTYYYEATVSHPTLTVKRSHGGWIVVVR